MELLNTICDMMGIESRENELIAPRAQAQSLQFFPQTFDLLLSVMSVKALGYVYICSARWCGCLAYVSEGVLVGV